MKGVDSFQSVIDTDRLGYTLSQFLFFITRLDFLKSAFLPEGRYYRVRVDVDTP